MPARNAEIGVRNDAAFRRPARVSRNVFLYRGARLGLLNGTHTGGLGVVDLPAPRSGTPGRPGTRRADAPAARATLTADLVETLGRLGHAYPYGQALGFCLERAGFLAEEVKALAALGADFHFYLADEIADPAYDRRWRVYDPGADRRGAGGAAALRREVPPRVGSGKAAMPVKGRADAHLPTTGSWPTPAAACSTRTQTPTG